MNHDLPFALAQIAAGFGVLHDRKAPFLEFMDGRIDVAGNVVAEILAHQSHQVIAGVAHMVFRLVLVPLHAHVAVDGIEALGDRSAALDIGFLDADNLEVAAPVARLVGGAAAGHAATDDKDIGFDMDWFFCA